jgi:hypothetical protein
VGTDATNAFTSTVSVYAQDSRAPHAPILGQHAGRSGPRPTVPPPQPTAGKGKQPVSNDTSTKAPFLFILFRREDYLRGLGESDEEDGIDGTADAFIDPRLLIHSTLGDGATSPMESPAESLRSQQPSPRKSQAPRYHSLTHLSNRQSIVRALQIHPSPSLRNLFGNLPFSNSVRTNNYPPFIQDAQVNNLFLPVWAMMPVNTRPDPGSVKHAFQALFRDTTALIEGGVRVEAIIEAHPNIAALFDEDEYNKSGVLSKWAAGMVHSTQLKGRLGNLFGQASVYTTAVAYHSTGNDFTAFASMYCFWYLARWMISPSPETYELMPEWCRPT